MTEFVVAYCPDRCIIQAVYVQNFYKRFPSCGLTFQYKEGLAYKHKKWGDFFAYNNRWWWVVEAKNAHDALNKMTKKIEELDTTNKESAT